MKPAALAAQAVLAGLSVLAALSVLASCGTSGDVPQESARPAKLDAAHPWGRDPFTRTSEVQIAGKTVGYLVEYQPIPAGEIVDRSLPTGSYRIQDREFEDVGFISPRGEISKLTNGGSRSIGFWKLDEGLLVFFGGSGVLLITPLEPMPPRAPVNPASAPAAGEGGKTGEDAPPDEEEGG